MSYHKRIRSQNHVTMSAVDEEIGFQPSVYSRGTQPIQPYYGDAYGMWPFDQMRRARNVMLVALLTPVALLFVGGGISAYFFVRNVKKIRKKTSEPIDWGKYNADGSLKE
jgi:hypothetical protein